MDENSVKRHARFVERHLHMLPSHHQDKGPHKLAIIFYSLVSLKLLGKPVKTQYRNSITWLRSMYIIKGDMAAFGPASIQGPQELTSLSLPNTLFGLLSLMIVEDEYFFSTLLRREYVGKYVGACQLADGSFSSFLNGQGLASKCDSHDLRFCYIAISILYIVGCRSDSDFSEYIDLEGLLDYVLSSQCQNGGFGIYDEPHGGYTSCALSLLSLLNKIRTLSSDFLDRTLYWIVNRQVSSLGTFSQQDDNDEYDPDDNGGLNGRENKLADTCYSFWCLNSLSIIRPDWKQMIDLSLIRDYLLNQTQNTIIGGFAKNDQDDPDIYHTMLGIAALKLMDNEMNGILCLPNETLDAFKLN